MKTKAMFPLSTALFLQGVTTLAQQNQQRPNIIFIMSDDHAAKAISCYDGSINKTPNIDRIAANGVRFTNCFCTNAVSGPSRAVILSGQLSHLNGMINNEVTFDSATLTLPKVLRANGYQTAIIGKWHLKSNPTGFDFWKVLPGQGEYFNPDFIENGKKVREQGYVTDLITDNALNWLKDRDKTKPFFIMIHNKAPHRPWLPKFENATMYDTVKIPLPFNFFDDYSHRGDAAKLQKMMVARDLDLNIDLKLPDVNNKDNYFSNVNRLSESDRKIWDEIYHKRNKSYFDENPQGEALAYWKYRRYINDYLATIKTVDDNVGRILDYLEANDLYKNTIVIYTSDQGFFLGEHGWFDKRFMYDESYRMPLIIEYPAKLKPSITNNQMLMNLDFAPTMLDWAGIQKPEQMQGLSFANYIDNTEKLRDATYYHYYEYPGEHAVKRHYGIRTEKYKLIHFYYDIDQWELYDLQKDPHEMMNVYNDTAYAAIQKELLKKLTQLQTEYKDKSYIVPLDFKTIENKALGLDYLLINQPAPKYAAGGKHAMLDGKVENPDFIATGINRNWIGFEKNNFEMQLDVKKLKMLNEIEIRFLDMPEAWVFQPDTVEFQYVNNTGQLKSVQAIALTKEKRKAGGLILHYKATIEDKNIATLKIKAVNHGVCPPGHAGEGKPAWIFTDELILK
ncbi:MAG: sulfatase [Bacteroidetes bacterium]|nr:sulfatase [Bacteroidota bacterium]